MNSNTQLEFYFPRTDLESMLLAAWKLFTKPGKDPNLKYTITTPIGIKIRSPIALKNHARHLRGEGDIWWNMEIIDDEPFGGRSRRVELAEIPASIELVFGQIFFGLIIKYTDWWPPMLVDDKGFRERLRWLVISSKTGIRLRSDDDGTYLLSPNLRDTLVLSNDARRENESDDFGSESDIDQRVDSIKLWIKRSRHLAKVKADTEPTEPLIKTRSPTLDGPHTQDDSSIPLTAPLPCLPPHKPNSTVLRQLHDEPSLDRNSYPTALCVDDIIDMIAPFTAISNDLVVGTLNEDDSGDAQRIGVHKICTDLPTKPIPGHYEVPAVRNIFSSPNGSFLVWHNIQSKICRLKDGSFGYGDHRIVQTRVIDRQTGTERTLTTDCEFGHFIDPQSAWIAGLSRRNQELLLTIHPLIPAEHEIRIPTRIHLPRGLPIPNTVAGFDFCVEKRWLAVTLGSQTVVVNMDTEECIATLPHEATNPAPKSILTRFSQDGQFLAVTSTARGIVDVYATHDWSVLARLSASQGSISELVWLSDNQSQLVLSEDAFSRWLLPAGECQWLIQGDPEHQGSRPKSGRRAIAFDEVCAWNSQRELMAIQHITQNKKYYTLIRNSDGQVVGQLASEDVKFMQLEFSSDGNRVLAANGSLSVWRIP